MLCATFLPPLELAGLQEKKRERERERICSTWKVGGGAHF